MAARVAVFNAEKDDEGEPLNGVTLAAPDDASYIFGGDDQLETYSFPVVEVYQASGSIGMADLGRGSYDLHDRLRVVVWCEGESGEVSALYEQVVGLGRCLLEVLLQPDAFGSAEIANEDDAVTWSYVSIPPDPTDDRGFDKFRTAGVFEFALEDETPSA